MSRTNPKILLAYPANQLMSIEIPRPDGSLGLLYLVGALRREGFHVDLLDVSVGSKEDSLRETFFRRVLQSNGLTRIGMSPARLREHLACESYDIVGINSNFTPQTRMALEVAKNAKDIDPETLVIAGGVNARALSDRFLSSGFVDVIVLTEGDTIISKIVKAWQKNTSFEGVGGITWVRNGVHITNPVAPDTILTNLNDLPFPAWDLLPFEKYDDINSPHGSITPGKRRRYAPIMTSRGCPFRCEYCHISDEKEADAQTGGIGFLRLKSIDRVMEEVEILRTFGVTHLYIEDDSLLAKKPRIKDLFHRLNGMGMKISDVNGVNLVHFSIPTSGGRLQPDVEYMEIMKAAGFDEIVFPVESGSQRILDTYASAKLRLDKLNVLELVREAVRIGIACPINMMIGFPDETEEEMKLTVELAQRLIDAGTPYITFFIPIPFPGSKLYRQAIAGGYLSTSFDTDAMNWKNAVMQNTKVSPRRIVELRDWAWETVNTTDYKRQRKEREIRDPRLAE
ncbi:B12-binding domain-containing radical SAM protein [Candidatus Peregrinibacteria bacterium]|nr:B12-binding domain-containing radical SAM protein [Candidatus Peregrinibacteria bacterium]